MQVFVVSNQPLGRAAIPGQVPGLPGMALPGVPGVPGVQAPGMMNLAPRAQHPQQATLGVRSVFGGQQNNFQ